MSCVGPGDNDVGVVDGQLAALGGGDVGWCRVLSVAVAVAQNLEPRDVCDSSSGVGAVTNGNRAAKLIGPPDNKLRKPGKKHAVT
jgi:hypothetical protein